MAQTSAPWTGGAVDNTAWRAMRRTPDGDGIVNDTTGGALAVTASGVSTQVQVAAGEMLVQGAHYRSDAAVTLDVGAVGTPPSSGQTRVDYVILRYDATKPVAADRVVLAVLPGTPGSSSPPTLNQAATGTWEVPLARITRTGNIAVTNAMITDLRRWHCCAMHVAAGSPAGVSPIGTVAFTPADILLRKLQNGSPAWHSIITEAIQATSYVITPASGMYADATPMCILDPRNSRISFQGHFFRDNFSELTAGSWITLGAVNGNPLPATLQTRYGLAVAALGESEFSHAFVRIAANSTIQALIPAGAHATYVALEGLSLPHSM